MTAAELGALFGVVWVVILAYVPYVRPWYGNKTPDEKQVIAGVGVIVLGLIAFALSCVGWLDTFACTQGGFKGLVETLFAALIGNVGVYQAIRKIAPYEPKK